AIPAIRTTAPAKRSLPPAQSSEQKRRSSRALVRGAADARAGTIRAAPPRRLQPTSGWPRPKNTPAPAEVERKGSNRSDASRHGNEFAIRPVRSIPALAVDRYHGMGLAG